MMTSAIASAVQSARTTPAPVWRVALACLLDVLLIAALVSLTIMLFAAGLESGGIVAAWFLLAFVLVQIVALFRTGQPFGWRLFGVRLVSLGGYPGLGLIKTRGSQYAVVDVMKGADPMRPISLIPEEARASRRPEPSAPARRSRVRRDEQAPTTEPIRRAQARQGLSDIITDTTSSLRRVREAVPVVSGDPLDEHTRVQLTGQSTWRPPRGLEMEPVAEGTIFAAQATPQWRVLLDGSDIGPLTEPMVFGRNPSPSDGARAVTVMDLSREVSKEHVRLTLAGGFVHVADLGSTNGTVLVAEGAEHRLAPGESYRFDPRAEVRFSGHTLTISGKGMMTP